jgi:hypothetical protein
MAALTDFLPEVLPYLPGCSVPLALKQLRAICMDFCSVAPIAQATIDPIDLAAGEPEYDIDAPNGTDVTLILSARLNGRPLSIIGLNDADFSAARTTMGTPQGIKQTAGNSFLLDVSPTYDMPQAVALIIATKPKRNANTVADVLLNDYAYDIGQGAIGRLLMMPNQPFSAPANAFAYTALYERARTNARIRAEQSFGQTSARVQPRRFI